MDAERQEEVARGRRALRVFRGLTQEELATRAGLTRPSVGRAEQGADIEMSSLRAIAVVLDCDVGDYAEGRLPVSVAGEPRP